MRSRGSRSAPRSMPLSSTARARSARSWAWSWPTSAATGPRSRAAAGSWPSTSASSPAPTATRSTGRGSPPLFLEEREHDVLLGGVLRAGRAGQRPVARLQLAPLVRRVELLGAVAILLDSVAQDGRGLGRRHDREAAHRQVAAQPRDLLVGQAEQELLEGLGLLGRDVAAEVGEET